jgi:glyoxylase-like metal-dependent hydrolase (beta-lactamase superfamily II)
MAPRRRRSRLAWTAVALLMAVIVFVVTARLMRHRSTPPEAIGPRVQRVRNLFTEIYGARTTNGVILFDGGIDARGDALDRLLGALSATRADVTDVFLSHGHFDHVAHAPLCTNAKIRVGAGDVEFLAQRAPQYGTFGVRALCAIFPPPPVIATNPIEGRTEIAVGADKVVAIPVPGHTPGSYLFVFAGILFAGDSINIDGDKLDFAMAPFTKDRDGNRRSIAALDEALKGVDVQTVCTGHQGCTLPGRAPAMLSALIERAKSSGD